MGQALPVCMAPLQGELKDLTQKVELLEKFQDSCLAILESKGLNPGKRWHTTAFKGVSACAPSWVILDCASGVWHGVS